LSRIKFLPRAKADLASIANFVARDNPRKAKSFVRELRTRCASLASHPWQGRAASAIGPGVRILSFRGYLILYRVESDIEIDRVIHGARDLDAALAEEL
jgi:toxin ParE1/3/4